MNIKVNGKELEWDSDSISYQDIVGLSGGMLSSGWMITCTRNLPFDSKGRMVKAGIIICSGESIEARDNDKFECFRG